MSSNSTLVQGPSLVHWRWLSTRGADVWLVQPSQGPPVSAEVLGQLIRQKLPNVGRVICEADAILVSGLSRELLPHGSHPIVHAVSVANTPAHFAPGELDQATEIDVTEEQAQAASVQLAQSTQIHVGSAGAITAAALLGPLQSTLWHQLETIVLVLGEDSNALAA